MRASVLRKRFETRDIVIKNPRNVTKAVGYRRGISTYDAIKNEVRFTCNVSPSNEKCWRLLHWDGKVRDLFEAEGYTYTIDNLFCGTKAECLAEISRLGLIYTPESLPGLEV